MTPDPTLQAPPPVGPASLAATLRPPDAAPADPPADPPAIGRYRVTGRLGAGAMGVVYAAHAPALDREIAVKRLHRDGHARRDERLLREAQAMAKLSHPNVAQVYEAGVADDHPRPLSLRTASRAPRQHEGASPRYASVRDRASRPSHRRRRTAGP